MEKVFYERKPNAAIYARLSREDGDSIESSSIISQKEILTEYVKDKSWNIFKIYVDDGVSGGTFNRPGFKAMIDDVELGNIDIIITKDLSRLGRNYIETGYYLEEYFPSKNVRYIALNDNYDSMNDDNDFTPFKNIINQWYLKDISKKVKSVHVNRMKKGLLPTSKQIPLFGYMHNDNGERIIDPVSSKTVKKIYELYLNGMLLKDIAKYLKDNKMAPPAYYNAKKYHYNEAYFIDKNEDECYKWTKSNLSKILVNEEYTGCLILNKKKTISYKTHKRVLTNKDEQYKYEDKFEEIISKEDYKRAQELRLIRTKCAIPIEDNPYKDFIFCGCCGKALSLQRIKKADGRINEFYKCRSSKCLHPQSIKLNELDMIIKHEAISFINHCLKNEDKLREYAYNYQNNKIKKNDNINLITTLKTRQNQLDILIQKLFERSITDELPQDTYKKILSGYKKEYEENNQKLQELTKANNNDNTDYIKLIDLLFIDLKELKNQPLDRKYISKIIESAHIIKNKKKIKLKLKYKKVPNLLEDYFNGRN